MGAARSSNGYRAHVLPAGLSQELPAADAVTAGDVSLIAKDHNTLIWAESLADGRRAVCKMYRDRGGISWWRERTFRFRVQREYDALSHLVAKGVPCSRPLFWSYGCCGDYGRYEILATEEIAAARPLDTVIQSQEGEALEAAWFASYQLLREMHESGLHHGSMYSRNILITQQNPAAPGAYIIDTPKAIMFPSSIVGTRMAQIDLLDLSLGSGLDRAPDLYAALLSRYGMPAEAILQFCRAAGRYRPSKMVCNLHRTECEVREILAACFGLA